MVDWISSPACLANLVPLQPHSWLLLMHVLLILDIGLRVFDFLRHPSTLGDKCGPRLAEVQPRVVEDFAWALATIRRSVERKVQAAVKDLERSHREEQEELYMEVKAKLDELRQLLANSDACNASLRTKISVLSTKHSQDKKIIQTLLDALQSPSRAVVVRLPVVLSLCIWLTSPG